MATQRKSKYPILAIDDTLANKLSTDTYVSAGTFDVRFYKTKHVVCQAATNNLKVTIFGSVDGGVTYPLTAVSEFTVTVGTPATNTITTYYTHLDVQVKAAAGGSQGTLSTALAAASI